MSLTKKSILLETSRGSSNILVGENLIEQFAQLVPLDQYSKIGIVWDSRLPEVFKRLVSSLPNSANSLAVDASEGSKSIAGAEEVWSFCVDAELDRYSLLVTLGGGSLCDLVGFCACTYQRGIPVVFVPTTLLSQVDAAIGGKNGINFRNLKNYIGTIAQPRVILNDISVLNSLPAKELCSGFAEIIKIALVMSPSLYQRLAQLSIKDLDSSTLIELIAEAVALKTEVVADDEYEHGRRRILNFGHTIGHAIESVQFETQQTLRHGEAVALGMIAECFLSMRLGLLSELEYRKVSELVENFGLPVRLPVSCQVSRVLDRISRDKKSMFGSVRWTLLSSLGASVFKDGIEPALVEEALRVVIER